MTRRMMPRKVRAGVTTTSLKFVSWSVMWITTDKKGKTKIMERKCGSDLAEALRIKSLLDKAGRRAVTLRSCNAAFAPPDSLIAHDTWEVVTRQVKRKGKVKTKKFKKKVHVDPLKDLNAKGIFWCPYCIKLRKLVMRDGFWHHDEWRGVSSEHWIEEKSLYCPMCDTSLKNWHMCFFNPMAWSIRSRIEQRRKRRAPAKPKRKRR